MEATILGGCQNSGPFLGTLNTRCRIIIGIQKGTVMLTTTHIHPEVGKSPYGGVSEKNRCFFGVMDYITAPHL